MLNSLKARPRLIVATLVGVATWFVLPGDLREATRLLISWDMCVGLYLVLVGLMVAASDTDKIRDRAAAEDENRYAILGLTVITAVASLAGIIAQLSYAKDMTGFTRGEHIALAAATVFLSWVFLQTMFALHYAHEYYQMHAECAGGLEFPANLTNPDYWDFVYFSFVIGTAAATADINITSRMIRKVVTLHCVTMFFFNTTILALTVNIGASLF